MPTDERSLFEDAIDVPLWLDADAEGALAERSARDRGIARTLQAAAARDDVARVRAWWSALRAGDGPGAALVRGRHVVSVALLVLGALAGGLLAAAALRYDGSSPVNVLTAFVLLVGVQLAALALTLLLLPRGRFGLGAVQRSLVALNPAAIAAGVYRRIGAMPASIERLFAWHGGRSSANRFAKWQLLCWSQLAGVGLNVGILVTAFVLIAVTDLAFGWSTTLDLDAQDVAAATRAVATPWAGWLPQAVPDAELIARSQFFRLADSEPRVPRDAAAFTGWWPFLLASIVAYGLVPRLVLLAVALKRLHVATRRLLLEDARVTALLDRMSSPSVELGAAGTETPRADPGAELALSAEVLREGGAVAAIVWAEAVDAQPAAAAASALLAAPLVAAPFAAGGAASLEDDGATIARVVATTPRRVVVFTRAYEPPLREFLDFARRLRSAMGEEGSIVVALAPAAGTAGVTAAELEIWRHTLARLRDPRLYVEALRS